jgi:transcriptional regulator with XRE-family HTH domain
MADAWGQQMEAMGSFIRSQRKLANLSLRQLADLTSLSNAYLSQLERGMHQPSVRVLQLLSGALDVSTDMLLAQAGLGRPGAGAGPAGAGPAGAGVAGAGPAGAGSADDPAAGPPPDPVEAAIVAHARLDDEQKAALLGVYHSMLGRARPGGKQR